MGDSIFGTPYFSKTTIINEQYPYLANDAECDIVVVGGGLAGALCAYKLTMAGADVILLDSSVIGMGSTSISSSILTYDTDYNLRELCDFIGKEKAIRAYNSFSRAIDEIEKIVADLGEDVGFSRRDSLFFTNDRDNVENMKREYLFRKRNDLPVKYFDSVCGVDYFPFHIEAGIFANNSAAEINPVAFTHALIKKAEQNGLRVYENTTVDNVTSDIDSITLETTLYNKITASKVVNATGINAVRDNKRIIEPKTTFSIVTEPLEESALWYNRTIIRDDSCPYTYMRLLPDNRILIGGLDSKIIKTNSGLTNFFAVESSINKRFEKLKDILCAMIPGLDDVIVDYKFAGTTLDTGDGLPYIGVRSKYPNIYYDICPGINGIVFAELGADIITSMFLEEEPEDKDLFAFGRI